MADQAGRAAVGIRWGCIAVIIGTGLIGTGAALDHRSDQPAPYVLKDLRCRALGNAALVSFDADTGAVRWDQITQNDPHLVERDGKVVVLTHPTYDVTYEQALDTSDGHLSPCTDVSEAEGTLNDPGPIEPGPVPAELDGLTVVRWGSGLRATDPAGTGVWGVEHAQPIERIGDDLLVSRQADDPGSGRVALLGLRDGTERWSVDGWPVRTIGDEAPLLVTPDGVHLTRVDPTDGSTIWSTKTPVDPTRADLGQVVIAGELLLVPLGEGADLAAVDAETGEVRWTADGGSPAADGREYTRGDRPGTYLPGVVTGAIVAPDGRSVIVEARAVDPVADD